MNSILYEFDPSIVERAITWSTEECYREKFGENFWEHPDFKNYKADGNKVMKKCEELLINKDYNHWIWK